jgi:Skp family chaperone for outer membrane proteins
MKQLLRIGFVPAALLALAIVALNSWKSNKASAVPAEAGAAAAGPDRVGVVNLEQVGKDLGWSKELDANIATFQSKLRDEYQQAAQRYEKELQQKKAELGIKDTDTIQEMNKKLTPQQQQDLGQMFTAGRQILGQVQQTANQQLNTYRGEWGRQYREALSPLIKQVAQDRRIAIVIPDPGPLLYSDPSVDITPAVIEAAKAHPPTFKPVPLPTIQVPLSIAATQPATQPSGSGGAFRP